MRRGSRSSPASTCRCRAGSTTATCPCWWRAGACRSPVSTKAVRRVLTLRTSLGLFDDPFRSLDPAAERRRIATPAIKVTAREVAMRAIVLLRDRGDLLPLPRSGRRIALIGPFGADRANRSASPMRPGRSHGRPTIPRPAGPSPTMIRRCPAAATGATLPIGRFFPFGSGLGYTRFALSDLRGPPARGKPGAAVRQLKAFVRITLAAGASGTVRLPIAYDDLAMIDADGVRRVEPGIFDLWASAGDLTEAAVFHVVCPQAVPVHRGLTARQGSSALLVHSSHGQRRRVRRRTTVAGGAGGYGRTAMSRGSQPLPPSPFR